jgi:hypothetical protein
MSGYNNILRVRRFEERVHNLGLRIGHPRYRNHSQDGDLLSLMPRDHEWPIYNRDAEMFIGTIDAANAWLDGLEFARNYDDMLKVGSRAKRERKEQDHRNKELLKAIEDAGEEVTINA